MASSLLKVAQITGFLKLVRPSAISKLPKWFIHSTSNIFGPKGIEVKMPSLSPTMTEGTIISWLKKEGDPIAPGDVLCEVQTDKAIVALELEEEGILAKIIIPGESKDIKIGTLIALMVEPGEDWKDVEMPDISSIPTATSEKAAISEQLTASSTPKSGAKPGKLGPAVRTLLDSYGLNVNDVQPTGPHHTVLKGDVLRYIEMHKLTPKDLNKPEKQAPTISVAPLATPDVDYIDIPLTNMRKVIAKRLTLSKSTIPHAYMNISSNVTKVVELRKQMKSDGFAVSVNDFIIKAVAGALQKVPALNVNVNGDTVQPLTSVDISIAVATDTGLITPIVKNSDYLSVPDISKTVKELAAKARLGKLQPHEFQGGSFSVSNLGMFGITEFSAVINPPQAAILAIGASIPVATPSGTCLSMTTTLSYDARAISEQDAADFLEVFKALMENPQLLYSERKRAQAFN